MGSFGLPEIFEERRNQVYAVFVVPLQFVHVPLTAKFSAENTLNDPAVLNPSPDGAPSR